MTMQNDAIKWILFDLGNVLVDHVPLGTGRISGFLGIETEVLHTFLLKIDASRKLCTGELGAEEFTSLVNSEFNGSITPAMITEWFGPEVDRVYPEIPGLIGSLAGRYYLGVLSNTFFGHWDHFITTELARQFNTVMASHLFGYVKPDPRIYQEALKRITASPAETLFIDDRKENVEAAQALGINSFQSKSPVDTIRGLQQLGIKTDH